MKRILLLSIAAVTLVAALLAKDVPVKGYFRKDGTYVAPYHRTSPNSTKNDNYSTKGNVNPYTGKEGTKPGDAASSTNAPAAGPATDSQSGDAKVTQSVAQDYAGIARADRWAILKGGMAAADVEKLLGKPDSVAKSTISAWKYKDGEVFVKDDRVVAWRKK